MIARALLVCAALALCGCADDNTRLMCDIGTGDAYAVMTNDQGGSRVERVPTADTECMRRMGIKPEPEAP
jgi:hypothetical protein